MAPFTSWNQTELNKWSGWATQPAWMYWSLDGRLSVWMCWCVGNRAKIDMVEIQRTAQPVWILETGRHQSQSGCVGKWMGIKFSVDMVVIGRTGERVWMRRWIRSLLSPTRKQLRRFSLLPHTDRNISAHWIKIGYFNNSSITYPTRIQHWMRNRIYSWDLE